LFKVVVSHDQKQRSGFVILIEDHSERNSLEEKLAHSERLASICQVAPGVTHEIANPVTGIPYLAQDL
jgi:nitrogen-specific signal transduction histidine kinase